jgi:hypothetical protein
MTPPSEHAKQATAYTNSHCIRFDKLDEQMTAVTIQRFMNKVARQATREQRDQIIKLMSELD